MATLQKIGQDEKCLLDQIQMRIGRAPDNEIIIEDETVSGYHALITIRPKERKENSNEYIIEDLNSTNKTFVNNNPIENHCLREGDIIRIGETRLKFSLEKYVPSKSQYDRTKKIDHKKPQGYTFPK